MSDDKPIREEEIEITPEMIEAGEEIILGETGGAGAILSGLFSASDLAKRVYLAMAAKKQLSTIQLTPEMLRAGEDAIDIQLCCSREFSQNQLHQMSYECLVAALTAAGYKVVLQDS